MKKLIEYLRNCEQQKACEIFNRLYDRDLFKMVAELQLKDETNSKVKRKLLAMKDDSLLRQELEQEIAASLCIDADYVIIRPLQIRNPNYGSRSYVMDPEAITIFDESQTEPRTMSDYTSELFFARPSFNDEASLETLQVYAPVNNQSQEEQSISELQEEIRTILRSAGKENN